MSKPSKTKELKIVTKHVVTIDDVARDPRKLKLLYLINALEEISEKALQYLIYWLKKEKQLDLGYEFLVIGNVPSSKELKTDIVALLYVGALETNPRNKKLRVTSVGKELLERTITDNMKPEFDRVVAAAKELEARVKSIDAEIELTIRMLRQSMGRRRRRRFI